MPENSDILIHTAEGVQTIFQVCDSDLQTLMSDQTICILILILTLVMTHCFFTLNFLAFFTLYCLRNSS